ncbi:ATP-binding protein [Streptomyces venezuelae]|uniref:ATP-binding protein n=1 Tax=Streptomyces venezuelae TaxID=54571 RepID=A0A5P2B9M1_STRVZ|nr:ATP-binding protein [Streptomyces venezuelae]QES27202.1 ATP-binding protein [Streptomyces venezuelae]
MSPATTALLSAAADLRLDPSPGFAATFPPCPSRVGEMRRRTASRLQAWKISQRDAEGITLAVSELVTNSVVHGEGSVCFVLRQVANEIRVEVTDSNPQPAMVKNASPDDISGRGMFLAAVFAQRIEVSDDGYTTTVAFPLSGHQR